MKLVIVFVLAFSSQCFAATAKVLVLKGTATYGGQKLTATSKIQGNGEIVVGDKSYLKLLINESNTTLVVGANSTSKINLADVPEKHEVTLVKGITRWVSGNLKGKGVKTANAVMGIRGTDFYASYNPSLSETEIICYDGEVQLTNAVEESDSKTISKNQWGGIGGRFGKKLSDVLTLSPELISSFDSTLPK